jgi:hypothetical protein
VAVGNEAVADDRVALLEAVDALADFLHPAGVFVAEDVGQLDVDLLAPDALDDVQVGTADARAVLIRV